MNETDGVEWIDGEPDPADTKGPGGIINAPRERWPEGWQYVEGESSPPVTDLGHENLAWLREQGRA